MTYQLRGSLEENILVLLAWSEDNCHTVALKVTPQLFSTLAYRKLAQASFDFIERYGKPPQLHLRDLVEDELKKEHGKLMSMALDQMDIIWKQIQPEFVLVQLDHWVVKRELRHAIDKAEDYLVRDDVEHAEEALASLGKDRPSLGGTLINDPVQALRFLDTTEEDVFPSGVEMLDRLGIRPQRKTLTVLMAETNKGKSWYCINLALACIMHQKSVLHISLEMSEERLSRRYIQTLFSLGKNHDAQTVRVSRLHKDEFGDITSLDYDEMVRGGISNDYRGALIEKLSLLKNKKPLLVKEFPPRTLTVAKLHSYINSVSKTMGFVPDLLIIDYGDEMAIEGTEHRLGIGDVFRGIRKVAVEYNLAAVSPTQSSRAAVGIDLLTRKYTAEDFSKVQTSDTFLTYSQTEREEKSGLARIFVDKARDDPRGHKILITQKYDIGQWCFDSVLMTEQTGRTVSSIIGGDSGGKPKRVRLHS